MVLEAGFSCGTCFSDEGPDDASIGFACADGIDIDGKLACSGACASELPIFGSYLGVISGGSSY
jgi:hypothetical protein